MYQLDDILGNASRYKVLKLFLKNPKKEFYATQVRKKTGLSKTTTGKRLRELREQEIIKLREEANAKFYRLKKENPFVKQMKILISLANILPAFQEFKEEAYIYGSVARGEDTEKSDLDLLVITEKEETKIIQEINHISKEIERKINPIIFTPIGYSKLPDKDKALYRRIERDKIKISEKNEY